MRDKQLRRSLSDEEREAMWQAISERTLQSLRRRRRQRWRAIAAAAAVALVALLGWWMWPTDRVADREEWMAMAVQGPDSAALEGELQITLPDGTTVTALDNAVITYSDSLLQIQEAEAAPRRMVASAGTTGLHTITVPYGKRAEVVLPDGTTVWLNAGSVFRFSPTFGDSRATYLLGEGFFQVVRNEKAPFSVHTPDLTVQVLGTSFNVSAYPDDRLHTTTLVEGSVSLHTDKRGGKQQRLVPGERATFDTDAKTLTVRRDDELADVLWTKKQLLLQRRPLAEIVRRLERMYNTEITWPREYGATESTFSGSLNLEQPIVKVLSYLFDKQEFTIEQMERRVIIEKKSVENVH